MSDALIVEVFRSVRREGMYLYVPKAKGLEDVPEALTRMFGQAESALVFVLKPERRLARVDTAEVIAAITQQGYFLQLPPSPLEKKEVEPC
jgi:uncharacterized protein YcgL (UPF0745 family)